MARPPTRQGDSEPVDSLGLTPLLMAVAETLLARDDWLLRLDSKLAPTVGASSLVVERTIDIDVRKVRRVYSDVVGRDWLGTLWVPLLWMEKPQLASLDAQGPHGNSLVVMGPSASCDAASWAFVVDLVRSSEMRIDRERAWAAARRLANARHDAGLRDFGETRKTLQAVVEELLWTLDPCESVCAEAGSANQCLTITQLGFLDLLQDRTLCVVQLPICVPDEVYTVRIRQHAHLERLPEVNFRVWARELVSSVQHMAVVLEAGAVVSVEPPPDMAVFDLERWYVVGGGFSPRVLLRDQEIEEYCGMQACEGIYLEQSMGAPSWDLSRAVSYARTATTGINDIKFSLFPREGFLLSAATWLAAVTVWMVLVLLSWWPSLPAGEALPSTVPILLAVPGLVITSLPYREESANARKALYKVRMFMWAAAMMMVSTATVVAISPSTKIAQPMFAATLSTCWAALTLAWGTRHWCRVVSRNTGEGGMECRASPRRERWSWNVELQGLLLPLLAAYSWFQVSAFGLLVSFGLVSTSVLWAAVLLSVGCAGTASLALRLSTSRLPRT